MTATKAASPDLSHAADSDVDWTGLIRQMTEEELAWGWIAGFDESTPPIPHGSSAMTPAEALQQILLPFLVRQPCVVMFSGGRDSSIVLGAAVAAARRYGLPLPVAATLRFPSEPSTDESKWQAMMLDKVGRDVEWVKLEFDDELDALGPYATAILGQFGQMWPQGLHCLAPIAELAMGGIVLTGEGGDELFNAHRAGFPLRLVRRRGRVERDIWLRAIRSVGPRALRRVFVNRESLRQVAERNWLTPDSRQRLSEVVTVRELDRPMHWGRSIGTVPVTRSTLVARWNRDIVFGSRNVQFFDPLLDPVLVRALQNAGGALGYTGRAEAMRVLFGDLVPIELCNRVQKSTFNAPMLGRHTREFVESWDTRGIPLEFVDFDKLTENLLSEAPAACNIGMMHRAWVTQRLAGLRVQSRKDPLEA